MSKIKTTTSLVAIILILGFGRLFAQDDENGSIASRPVGFADKNGDGINDRFQDADGDGVNDLTGKAYPHRFKYIDKNKDGINDLWLDRDGDGVNDLSHQLSNDEREDVDKCIVDFDRDGVNDVTGLKYKKEDFMGGKHGFIDEQSGKIQGKFLDEDGNGVDDRMEIARWRNHHQNRDMFIDEDGDGICDGRGDALRRHTRSGEQHRRGRH